MTVLALKELTTFFYLPLCIISKNESGMTKNNLERNIKKKHRELCSVICNGLCGCTSLSASQLIPPPPRTLIGLSEDMEWVDSKALSISSCVRIHTSFSHSRNVPWVLCRMLVRGQLATAKHFLPVLQNTLEGYRRNAMVDINTFQLRFENPSGNAPYCHYWQRLNFFLSCYLMNLSG